VTKIGALGTTQAATSNRRTLRRNTKWYFFAALPFSSDNRLNLSWDQLSLYELSTRRYCPIFIIIIIIIIIITGMTAFCEPWSSSELIATLLNNYCPILAQEI
jgi:hypothetical protein